MVEDEIPPLDEQMEDEPPKIGELPGDRRPGGIIGKIVLDKLEIVPKDMLPGGR